MIDLNRFYSEHETSEMHYGEAREATLHSHMAFAIKAVRAKFPDSKLTDQQIADMIMKEYDLDKKKYM